jgi:hypothetical protein
MMGAIFYWFLFNIKQVSSGVVACLVFSGNKKKTPPGKQQGKNTYYKNE